MSFKIFWRDIRLQRIMSEKKVSFGWAVKEYVLPRKKIVSVGLVLIVIKSIAGLALPFVTRTLLDVVFPNKDFPLLMTLVTILAGALLIQALTSFALTRLLSVEAQRLISILRADVQKKLMKLPINFFDNQKSGALVSRVMTDVEGVRNIVGTGLVQLIGGSLTAIFSLFLLLQLNWFLTVVVLVPVIIFAIIMLKAFGYIRPNF